VNQDETAVGKVFMTGRSQAVRLPKDFRFDVEEVELLHYGSAVIMKPHQPATSPSLSWGEIAAMGANISDEEWALFEHGLYDDSAPERADPFADWDAPNAQPKKAA
jgi:antitoxin VapB